AISTTAPATATAPWTTLAASTPAGPISYSPTVPFIYSSVSPVIMRTAAIPPAAMLSRHLAPVLRATSSRDWTINRRQGMWHSRLFGFVLVLVVCFGGCDKKKPSLAGGKPVQYWIEALHNA